MKYILPFFLIAISAGLISCDNDEAPAKELEPFHSIHSNGGVKFTLITGTENKVISTSLSEAYYSVSGDQLSINATGGSMTIAVRNLDLLWCNACDVESPGPLVVDTLNLYVHAGSVDLRDVLVSGRLGLSALNTGTYEFSGYANIFDLSMINNTYIKAYDLITDSTFINSTAAVDAEVHATHVLDAFISSAGNVYYKGDPSVVRVSETGTGRVIKK